VGSSEAGSAGEFDSVVEDPGGEAGGVAALKRLGGEEVQPATLSPAESACVTGSVAV